MNKYMRTALATFSLLLFLGMTGCSGPSAIRMQANIQSGPTVNPDYAGRPSPIVVRIYQLRSPGPFMDADYFDLYDNASATLGDNLIKWQEMQVSPGKVYEYITEYNIETRHVGVVAAFRDIDNARWRELLELPDNTDLVLNIKLNNLALSAAVSKR